MKWVSRVLLQPIRSRLFYKMLIIYSLLTLIPLIVVSTTISYQSANLLGKEATEAAQNDLEQTANLIDEKLYALKKRMIDISTKNVVLTVLKNDGDPVRHPLTVVERAGMEIALSDLLESELEDARSKIGDFIDNLYVLNAAGELYGTETKRGIEFGHAFQILPVEFEQMPEWAFFTDYGRMACSMMLFDPATGDDIGRLILTLDPEKIQTLYGKFERDKFYITNSDNLVVSAHNPGMIGRVLDIRGPENQLEIKQKSRFSGYWYVSIAKPGAGDVVRKQILISAGITLVTWLVVFVVTSLILRRVTQPIQRLTRLMRRAEREDYQPIVEVRTRDEIAALCHSYNQLVQRTKDLIEKNYKNELLKRQAELEAVRMYINPHFLYNTLEYISILSQSPERAKHIPDIVQNLSSIFRFSIRPGETFIPLETEIAFVEKYLQIHQYRYGDRMKYGIEVPEMLRYAAVPKLILQPLVENAVIHGIDRLPGGGRVNVRVYEENYRMVIEIENDAEPPSRKAQPDERRRAGLGSGIENVNKRIRLHFGNVYGAVMHRKEDSVLVRVTLPIEPWNRGVEQCG